MTNDLNNIPAAACNRCGGWTNSGGMSQHYDAIEPVLGRTGCTCNRKSDPMADLQNTLARRLVALNLQADRIFSAGDKVSKRQRGEIDGMRDAVRHADAEKLAEKAYKLARLALDQGAKKPDVAYCVRRARILIEKNPAS